MSHRRFSLVKVSVASALLLAMAALNAYVGWNWLKDTTGPALEAKYLYIKPGSGLIRIAWLAEQEGLVRDSRYFRLLATLRGDESALKAGEYKIPRGTSLDSLISTIVDGKAFQRSITVPEGLSSIEIYALVKSTEFLVDDINFAPAEGTVMPDTWNYARGDRASGLIRRMQSAQQRFLKDVGHEGFNNFDELVTFASIIEKETGESSERSLVSAVFHNRLKRGMRLQSDPTIIYGITGGEKLDRPIRRSDISANTPYNTYVNKGLPPTPIANPGREAIKAALSPAAVDYLYFVASGDGGHRFANTLEAHNKNVALWRKFERANQR